MCFTTEEFLESLTIPQNLKIAIMINGNDLISNGELKLDRLKKLVPKKPVNQKWTWLE